ncbi:MAG: NAD(P)H-hydrate epimerase, partial [Clostridia bacterium]|nr:NAD(P)H-hydrate epimerase [Clostridia bacterium]
MKRVLCSRRMKACDRKEILSRTPSSVLMDRAAEAVFEVLKSDFNCERVLFVCGGGNNGGDGILAAVKAFSAGFDTAILFCGDEALCTAETSDCLKKARDCGVPFVTDIEKKYTVIVDAIFGIGLSREIDGSLAEIIEKVNGSGAKVLSVDIPSGICADNGEIMGTAVKADVTVAVAAYKMGHFTGEAADYVGRIVCVDIGIPTEDADNYDGFGDIVPYALDFEDIALLPERPRNANKGTCGRVLIVGGAKGMCGAVYLSALAAYRSGAGLVEVFCDEANRIPLQTLLPEAVVTCSDFSEPDMNKLSMAL